MLEKSAGPAAELQNVEPVVHDYAARRITRDQDAVRLGLNLVDGRRDRDRPASDTPVRDVRLSDGQLEVEGPSNGRTATEDPVAFVDHREQLRRGRHGFGTA